HHPHSPLFPYTTLFRSAGAIHAHALCVRAKVTPSRKAIATMSTGDVPLAYHEIALCESFHMIAYIVDNANKLVTDCHWHRDCFRSEEHTSELQSRGHLV